MSENTSYYNCDELINISIIVKVQTLGERTNERMDNTFSI
jgi:hypothetical protein